MQNQRRIGRFAASRHLLLGVCLPEESASGLPRCMFNERRPANFMPLSNEACELSTRVTGT